MVTQPIISILNNRNLTVTWNTPVNENGILTYYQVTIFNELRNYTQIITLTPDEFKSANFDNLGKGIRLNNESYNVIILIAYNIIFHKFLRFLTPLRLWLLQKQERVSHLFRQSLQGKEVRHNNIYNRYVLLLAIYSYHYYIKPKKGNKFILLMFFSFVTIRLQYRKCQTSQLWLV